MAYNKTPDTGVTGPNVGNVATPPSALPPVQGGGGGGNSAQGSGGNGAAPQIQGTWKGNFHADDLINQYFTGLTDQQRAYIRNQLANQGISEHSHPQDFVKGLQSLAQGIPGLQAKSTANSLFGDGSQTQAQDPLAQQMFFFKTIAPYLQQIGQQTRDITTPMYAKAAAALKNVPNSSGLQAMIQALQGSENNLQGSLAASTAEAPALDALMQNVTQQRAAEQKDFYEQERAAVYGGAGGTGGTDLQSLLNGLKST